MVRFRSLTVRFGVLYFLVILGLGVICVAFLLNLSYVRSNTRQVIAEVRKQAVLTGLRSRNLTLEYIIQADGVTDIAQARRAEGLLQTSLVELEGLGIGEAEISREGRSEPEGQALTELAATLRDLNKWFQDGDEASDGAVAQELLAAANVALAGLRDETQLEVDGAIVDLDKRTEAMRMVMFATVLGAAAFLAFALHYMHRRIIRPLNSLRYSAERFGMGELSYRIRMDSTDEIGNFATTLNQMADRLQDAHEDLESRVRERTSEFLRAARMAHLGVLASGIAHEINTPLASIRSCAEGMDRRMKLGEYSEELFTDYTETICREVERSRGITGRMLALAREEPTTSTVNSLDMVLEQVSSALSHRASRKRVRLVQELPEEEINLRVDGGELVQIIVNLVANAIDASPPDSEVLVRAEVTPEQMILTVQDQGEGIPPDRLEHIFEPFYTTKAPSEGTGLGLALVSKLVESHRGRVSAKSAPGEGSIFRVVLPLDWRRSQ